MDKMIYLDNAATTAVRPEVLEAMKPFYEADYANPSSAYAFAGKTAARVEEARETIAAFLNAAPEEIFFTGGGSESDNWALKGITDALAVKGNHIITTKIEHHAILHTAEYLERHGVEVTYLEVDEEGKVDPAALEAAIRPETILVSVMFANNEIGTIEP
ncbi:MAG: aminotransferase class V-fold PLP-dependent enzyme, partial [Lachnospiraceae bacterium]|nr:aminotransferase class V-fold PLP-dependent enzyme [Lachnospiraceae bacterium]